MKKYITLIMLMGALIPAGAQAQTLSLDSCRAMALRNNKQLNASKLKKDVAYNMKKSARTKYLPKVDALGGYEWFSREISLLNRRSEINIQQYRLYRYRRNIGRSQQSDEPTCKSGNDYPGDSAADRRTAE